MKNFREGVPFHSVCSIFGWIEIHALYTISGPFDCLHGLSRLPLYIDPVELAPTDWIRTGLLVQDLCTLDESRRMKYIWHFLLWFLLFYKRRRQCWRVPTSSCTAPMDLWIRPLSLEM